MSRRMRWCSGLAFTLSNLVAARSRPSPDLSVEVQPPAVLAHEAAPLAERTPLGALLPEGLELDLAVAIEMATAGAIIGLQVPGVQVVDIGTTQKTLPDFVGMWLSMLHPEPAEDDA